MFIWGCIFLTVRKTTVQKRRQQCLTPLWQLTGFSWKFVMYALLYEKVKTSSTPSWPSGEWLTEGYKRREGFGKSWRGIKVGELETLQTEGHHQSTNKDRSRRMELRESWSNFRTHEGSHQDLINHCCISIDTTGHQGRNRWTKEPCLRTSDRLMLYFRLDWPHWGFEWQDRWWSITRSQSCCYPELLLSRAVGIQSCRYPEL